MIPRIPRRAFLAMIGQAVADAGAPAGLRAARASAETLEASRLELERRLGALEAQAKALLTA